MTHRDHGRYPWEEKAPLAREGARPPQVEAKLLRESAGERCKSIFPSMPIMTTLRYPQRTTAGHLLKLIRNTTPSKSPPTVTSRSRGHPNPRITFPD